MSLALRGMASRPPRLAHAAWCSAYVDALLCHAYPWNGMGGGLGGGDSGDGKDGGGGCRGAQSMSQLTSPVDELRNAVPARPV